MDKLIPWVRLEAVIEPHYPKVGNRRRPYPLATMLRIHCMQQWYNLSDPGMEDALYEIAAMRLFAGLSLDKAIPDHFTILKLARQIFDEVNQWLSEAGVLLKEGSLIDASIIEAPSSTRNRSGERDPEMHQTQKGNQWHFGLKAYIGVDARTGITHSFTTTAANEHDLNQAEHLLQGDEAFIFADAGYRGAEKRDELKDVSAVWYIAEQPGKLKVLKKHPRINNVRIRTEYLKASLRAKVEHPFRIIKCQLGFVKARYRGLKKNDGKLAMLFALSNFVREDQMLRAQG
jgi:IS5 family transposase